MEAFLVRLFEFQNEVPIESTKLRRYLSSVKGPDPPSRFMKVHENLFWGSKCISSWQSSYIFRCKKSAAKCERRDCRVEEKT